MAVQHRWAFKTRLRSGAYKWSGSHLACQRLKEAAAEIKAAAKSDPVVASEGYVSLVERIWPAFESIDTSSGALGSAVYSTQVELLPIIVNAPAPRKVRDAWLDRLWSAIEEDGVGYLSVTEEHWGELCASPEVASSWADLLLPSVRAAWSDARPGSYAHQATACLSSLVAADRLQDLLDLLALVRFPFWNDRKFAVRALIAAKRSDEALAYAEASRGLNQPDSAINAACEQILLNIGRADEAYRKYALTAASATSTGLATFRAICKKYPGRDPRAILNDLAEHGADRGLWFAAAKDAGFLDLALQFALAGRTEPRTLTRACRDFLDADPEFALQIGRLAIDRLLSGHGYEPTSADAVGAYNHFIDAAERLELADKARKDVVASANQASPGGAHFAATFLRLATQDPSIRELPVVFTPRKTSGKWKRR